MDAFTENILARARERQKMLEGYSNNDKTPFRESNKEIKTTSRSEPNLRSVKCTNRKEIVSDSVLDTATDIREKIRENKIETSTAKFTRQNSTTRVSSDIPGSPQSQLKTLNIQKENFNMEIKLTATENVRVEVEIEEKDDSDTGSTVSDGGLRDESKSKLKRLGKLYAGGDDADISSPIHKTEAKFYEREYKEERNMKSDKDLAKSASKSRKGLSKLADLAQTINEWEDDVHQNRTAVEKKQPSTPRKTWKPPAPQPPNASSPPKPNPSKPSQKPKAPDPPVVTKDTSVKRMVEERGNITGSPNKSSGSPQKLANVTEVKEAVPKHIKWDQNVLDTLEQRSKAEVRTAQTTQISRSQEEIKPDTIIEEEEFNENKIMMENNRQSPVKDVPTKNQKVNVSCPSSPQKFYANNQPACPRSPSKANVRAPQIANKAAMFESSPSKAKDPALLSVSERKALFEKNRGNALVPKAPIGMSAPVKVETTMKASSTKIITDENVKPSSILSKDKQSSVANKKIPVPPKSTAVIRMEEKTPSKAGKCAAPRPAGSSPTIAAIHQEGGIASKMAALLENKNKSTISQEQIESSIKEQRQKEMDMLLNRFQKNKEVIKEAIEEDSDEEIDATEETAMIHGKSATIVGETTRPGEKRKSGGKRHSKGDSPVVTSVLEEVKRIKVSPPKPGKLYPNLSDIETATETEAENHTRSPSPDSNSSSEENYESDDPNTSFGREILQAVCSNQTPQKRPIYDESTASDVSSILDDMDNYLAEASDEDNSTGPTPPKQGRHVSPQISAKPSNSFNYKSYSPNVATSKNKFQSPVKIITSPKRQAELPTHIMEGDNVLPLTHTVSFYRRQQNQVQTPVRQVSRQPLIEESPQEASEDEEAVQKKLFELQGEVNRQQNIISQTSQALNLCSATLEFSGSTEQVEAERVLLVATHRRQAALHELQRLRVEKTVRPQSHHAQNLPLEKGTLTISNIVLPLKQKYVKALAAAGGKGHHVVCLIKCGEQVVPTKLVSTVVTNAKNPDVDLYVPGNVTLNNIYSDFTVTFEVYCLQAQEEFLPHEIKYHISNKKSGTKLTTPKKSKQDSKMVMPIKESPAGPQAVRTSSFALMGYVVFSVQAVNKKVFSLNNTPSMSPLDGSVEMRISCELAVSVEHRGFLTMFEDVSGFGAWHRRWCLLKGHTLSYWKYPDDERKMAPIDTVDLRNCITKHAGPVSRDICARLHTFLLERERPAQSQDKDTLVTVCKGDKTIIRHLLSADTKEERIEWCNKFNAALTALRMWGNAQQ
ncbi:anillin-like isoform X2 [Anoplophora glabripennis]|uniref:anillin-like isoform X2 n=1 Tax=Anoplophora glabripennis TaxID=217634 RepID=UPI0008750CB5|nr:anillin-like isoform X2 [Anoplophora glabripennis]